MSVIYFCCVTTFRWFFVHCGFLRINKFFINLSESKQWRSRFKFSQMSENIFKSHINDELDEYFARFVESYMPRNVNPQQEYEDIPFFYPIAGAIRFNLIARIK